MMTKKSKPAVITHEDLWKLIQPGNRIFFSSGPATPLGVFQAMLNSNHHNIEDIEIIQLGLLGDMLSNVNASSRRIRLKTFSAGESVAISLDRGTMDVIPTNLSELTYLFASGAVGVDMAVIQTSPPRFGMLNLGAVNDVASLVIKRAPIVIAEINPHVPITHGQTWISMKDVDYTIDSSLPLLQYQPPPVDDEMRRIGWHVSTLIDDGSTVSLSIGSLYNAIAGQLTGKQDIKICSHIVGDWIIDLIESGAVRKSIYDYWSAPVTATSCIGSERLYRYIHRNNMFDIRSLLYSRNQRTMQNISKLVSVLNAEKIDISGDSVLVPTSELQLAGFDGKLNFATAATNSRDGKSIVVLKSTDRKGESNIVIRHKTENEYIRSTLVTTRFVITEFGVANMFGKSIRERALNLIEIAHPKFRKALIEEARKAGVIYPDQIFVIENVLNYPHDLQNTALFKGGLDVTFRPIKPSDEDMMRRLFYQFSKEAKFMRYFSVVRSMPHARMQPYVNIDYDNTLSIVGIIRERGIERIIAEGRYARHPTDNTYEMAFVVDEEFQGRGIASYLLDNLLSIAEKRNIQQLTACVLPDNEAMICVFNRARIEPDINRSVEDIDFVYNLNEERAMISGLR